MNSHSHKHLIVLAVAPVLLLTASSLCWTGYSSRTAASMIQRSDSSPGISEPGVSGVDASPPAVTRANSAYGKLPLSFEENRGQTDPRATFISRGSGSTLFLTRNGAVLAFRDPHKRTNESLIPVTAIRMTMVGANPNSEIAGSQRLPGNSSYFTGNDPNKWLSGIPTYARVRYRELYPAINPVY